MSIIWGWEWLGRGKVGGVRHTCAHTQPSLGFPEADPNKRKYLLSGSSVVLMAWGQRSEWTNWLETIKRQQEVLQLRCHLQYCNVHNNTCLIFFFTHCPFWVWQQCPTISNYSVRKQKAHLCMYISVWCSSVGSEAELQTQVSGCYIWRLIIPAYKKWRVPVGGKSLLSQ